MQTHSELVVCAISKRVGSNREAKGDASSIAHVLERCLVHPRELAENGCDALHRALRLLPQRIVALTHVHKRPIEVLCGLKWQRAEHVGQAQRSGFADGGPHICEAEHQARLSRTAVVARDGDGVMRGMLQ